MSKKSPKRWILTVLRLGLCGVALVYLYFNVHWHDRAKLVDGTEVRVLEQREGEVVVVRDGAQTTIGLDQIARLDDGQGPPAIELGIARVVSETDLRQALLAILIFLPASILQSVRLIWMLAIQSVRLSFWNAIKLTFAGNFFNFALPGTTGGDLIKAYYLTRFTEHKTEAVTTVFLDRVIGLLGLVILAGTMILLSPDRSQTARLVPVLAAIGVGLAVGVVLVFSQRVRNLLRLREIAARLPAGEQLLRAGRATVAMRRHKGLVLLSLANTAVLQIVVMYSAYRMAMAMGMGGSLSHYLIYVSIGFLIAAIPITPPQGFGVMESAYIVFFAKAGYASESQAVAFALAVRLIALVWALPGVLVPLLGAHLPSKREMEAIGTVQDSESATAVSSR